MTPHKKHELATMQQFVDEAEAILTNPTRPIAEFGRLLHESWKIKRTLSKKISSDTIDDIYQAGLGAGALGGKLLGAGGGGFMLFFVPPERQPAVRARLNHLLCVPFGFSQKGSQVVVYEPEEVYARTADGALTVA
jgi:D-glycero-alpha-D-manno-heptose-7-phosphate kinase